MATDEKIKRKLAAILCADVVGYSRLMGADESGTLARLKAHRKELIDPTIAKHDGRMVKLMGDGALVEFSSVVDALACAVDVQRGMTERNHNEPSEQRIEFRIGINLGDVIIEGDDIYGDGVNVAARLEGLSDPGGICISESVRSATGNKLPIDYEFMGEQEVKNIAEAVRAHRVLMESEEVANTTVTDKPELELPDKPSVAVLPFANMSADPDQEFFADGITEDIITELSKFRSLFVIARNSSFAFKGRSIDVKDVSTKLGVRYVVEGSVRRAGNRVRITAQLIDAVEDNHLWAERYDRDLEDIFAVQDEVTHTIVTTIEPHLASTERQRARRKPTESLGAWELYQRGLWHLYQNNAEDSTRALDFLQSAIDLDPTFASAHAGLAYALYYHVVLGYSQDRSGDLARALDAGKTAVMLDENDPFAHVALGRVYTIKGEHDTAIAACDRAIALNPNYASAYMGRAHSLWQAGRPAEALPSHDEAMRLSPRDPLMWAFVASKAIALILLGRYDEGLDWARKAQRQPSTAIWAFMPEVSALGLLGRIDEARAALERVKRIKPDVSCAFVDQALAFTHATDRDHFVSGLVKAGLKE
ncbi:MAG: adenylate/guanylate cyclase domain-containing protein [Gammaproteobacteria bacterium]|nr:adenylate/guanylate cyclase domain-containing protein [Gammaproteobacteria bacterium]